MFTYKIPSRSVTVSSSAREAFLSKEEILKRNLDKCWFVAGDRVKFKKPRRNPIYGTVVEVVDDPNRVQWAKGDLVPMNIVLDLEKVDHATGVISSTARVKTNVKKLCFVSRKKEDHVV